MKGLGKFRAGAVLAASGALLALAAPAQAQRPASLGDGAPVGQSGIQLYNFSGYLSSGAGEITCPAPPAAPTPHCIAPPAPTTNAGRLERVFQFLQARGIKDIELYGYPGNPFPGTNPMTPNNTAGLQALRALGDQYGLRFRGRHGNLTEANWDNQIAASRIVGQDHIGEAGFPGGGGAYNTYQGALNTAALLNRLGKRSVEAGLGPAYFHNHQPEFQTRHMDNGVLKSAWDIIMERTDPRWVHAQIDIGWAVCGAAGHQNPIDPAYGQQYVTNMITKYTNRIVSFHVKDMVNIRPTCGNADQRELGMGDINFAPMFVASKNRTKYYLSERDPVAVGGPTNFNPFVNTANSANNLKSAPIGVLAADPQQFTSVAAGTPAAANQKPIVITNDGDGPLIFPAAAPTIAADALDGGNGTAADFAIVSQDCSGKTLAPGQLAVADDPTTPANEATPAVPAGTCTVNVGFKPTRTTYTSVARLQFNTNSDDAMDRVLLAGKSTGDALGTVGGDVPTALNLQITSTTGGSFGSFVPAVSRNYDTALAATVTTTTGDAALSVTDSNATATGHLVNGTFSLPAVLQARGTNAAQPNPAYAALSETAGTPLQLLTWSGPTTSEAVSLGFRQAIGATDVLRAGPYSKTLTFTLSTQTP